jgi:hypothetical protein
MRRLFLIIFLAAACFAQGPPAGGDPLRSLLIPPELIMGHQGALNLSEGQGEEIRELLASTQGEFSRAQWNLKRELERLNNLLRDRNSPDQAVLDQSEKVMTIEMEIKKLHLSMLLGVRRVLSDEQYEQALQIKKQMQGHGTPPGGGLRPMP